MMNERTKFVKQQTGKTLKELAKEIGYSEITLTMILRGKRQSSYGLAKVLAEKTGVSPMYFLEN